MRMKGKRYYLPARIILLIPPLTETGNHEFPSISTKLDWKLCKQVETQVSQHYSNLTHTDLANHGSKYTADTVSFQKHPGNFCHMNIQRHLFFMSNVTHFRNYLAIIKRINWFCKRTVAIGDEFWEFRNYWNLLLVFLPFSVAKKKIVHTFEALLPFLFHKQKRKLFLFKSALHPFNKHRLPSFLAKSCLKAFLITLLLIDLAPDNCLFAAVKKTPFL